ncbi:MAG: 30S ribosomal protein S6 [Desulfobacteraceae bacterium]|nr:MAG: 30S ribosomal protein S6 [Desulfobacteraceae bacterium]
MRRYETIFIIDPDLPESDRTSFLSRIKEIIPQQEGVFIQEDLWGIKKLAYEVRKKPRGYYARIDYCGMGKVVDELERFCRIDDRVMKYLTVQLSSEADVEKIQAEIAAAQASKTETTAANAETAAASPSSQPAQQDQEQSTESDEDEITTES